MASVDVQDLLRSRDCVFYACVEDAEPGTNTCARHRGFVPSASPRVVATRVAQIERERPARRSAVVSPMPPKDWSGCKICGGEIPLRESGRPQYDRGVFARLCATHIEEKRAELSRPRGPRAGTPAPVPPEPKPAAPTSPPSFAEVAQRLAELGREVDEARAAIAVATERANRALAAWQAALAELSTAVIPGA